LTTQLYFEGDRYLDSDVASGVRDGLITSLMRRESAAELAARGLREPYFELTYDLVLAPERAPQAVALA